MLSEMIKINSALTSLNLMRLSLLSTIHFEIKRYYRIGNKFGVEGIRMIEVALMSNTTLTELNVEGM